MRSKKTTAAGEELVDGKIIKMNERGAKEGEVITKGAEEGKKG